MSNEGFLNTYEKKVHGRAGTLSLSREREEGRKEEEPKERKKDDPFPISLITQISSRSISHHQIIKIPPW